ncbi:transcription factor MYB36-like [Corylus avellana]|uniref:transcription factor MYB36-like n=1 Tax=Corylus avellana TaxID=13451 RepID=UPI00286A2EC8|nr:transcription factor MYB36-like [Corylus avellana]
MQLQSLQKPFSFYNNPGPWPKLHPLQEKIMIQSLQSMNQSSPTALWQGQNIDLHEPPTAAIAQEALGKMSMPKVNELENSFIVGNNITADGIEQSNIAGREVSGFQAELDDFLNNKTVAFVPQEDQITEFDCFQEMNGSKDDSVIWWSNDFETKSASSNSWDSTSVLQSEQMFQDYGLGYNM